MRSICSEASLALLPPAPAFRFRSEPKFRYVLADCDHSNLYYFLIFSAKPAGEISLQRIQQSLQVEQAKQKWEKSPFLSGNIYSLFNIIYSAHKAIISKI